MNTKQKKILTIGVIMMTAVYIMSISGIVPLALANPVKLTLEAYDADNVINGYGDLGIYVNDILVEHIPRTVTEAYNNTWISHTVDISIATKEGANTLLFKNPQGATSQGWCNIRNIIVTYQDKTLVQEPTEHLISGLSATRRTPGQTWSTSFTITTTEPPPDGNGSVISPTAIALIISIGFFTVIGVVLSGNKHP